MSDIRQTIAGKKLAKLIKIPGELENKELELIIRPIIRKKNRFLKIYSSPIKVGSINIPPRNERNER